MGSTGASGKTSSVLLWERGTCAGCLECPGRVPAPWSCLFCQSQHSSVRGLCSFCWPGGQPRLVLTISTSSVPAPAGSALCNLSPVSGDPREPVLAWACREELQAQPAGLGICPQTWPWGLCPEMLGSNPVARSHPGLARFPTVRKGKNPNAALNPRSCCRARGLDFKGGRTIW